MSYSQQHKAYISLTCHSVCCQVTGNTSKSNMVNLQRAENSINATYFLLGGRGENRFCAMAWLELLAPGARNHTGHPCQKW